MGVLITVIVIVVVLAIVIFWVIGMYNGLARARVRVREAWSGIDVQLQRKLKLIPNMVETVKGYAAHERETFERVTQARSMLQNAQGPAQAAQADNILTGALRSLFAVSEAYPDLKANQNFLELQRELTDTEDKIAYARQFYNSNVRSYNERTVTVPSSIIAGMFNFQPAEFYEAPDAAAADEVTVSFSTT